jgi:hypothetical protein
MICDVFFVLHVFFFKCDNPSLCIKYYMCLKERYLMLEETATRDKFSADVKQNHTYVVVN